jgi:hypothetical protein
VSSSDGIGPRYGAEDAAALLGKTILLAVRYRDRGGNLTERQQLHGTIISVDEQAGIEVRLAGHRAGELFRLPPEIQCCEEAKPGRYTLKGTGEVVENPDLVVTVTITELNEGESGGLA